MASDMSGTFIAVDEVSDIKKMLNTPYKDIPKEFFFKPVKPKYSKCEYTTCNIDLSKVVPSSIDPNEIYKAMQQLMEAKNEMLYYRNYQPREDINIGKKAYEILKTPDHWVQNSVIEFRNGLIARCLLGAILAKYGLTNGDSRHHEYERDCAYVASIILRKYPNASGHEPKNIIALWNDRPERTFNEVQDILRLADV